MRKYILHMTLTLTIFTTLGCGELPRTELKCVKGSVYTKLDGVWIEALFYKANKCIEGNK